MAEEFYNFEEALRQLNMEAEELKRLVSAGEIRAFRSQGEMKFRKEDIERLKQAAKPVAGEEETLAEELVFDEAEPLPEEEGMATAKIEAEDTLVDEGLPELESEVPELKEEPKAAPARTPAGGGRGRTTTGARRSTRLTQLRERRERAREASPLFMGLLVVTAVVMLYGLIFVVNIANSQNTGFTQGITELMVGPGAR